MTARFMLMVFGTAVWRVSVKDGVTTWTLVDPRTVPYEPK